MPYVTRPRSVYYDDRADETILYPENISVFESDATYTGILDARGEPIYRVMGRIGFDASQIYRPKRRKK